MKLRRTERRPGIVADARTALDNVNRLTAQMADASNLPTLVSSLIIALAAALLVLALAVFRLSGE